MEDVDALVDRLRDTPESVRDFFRATEGDTVPVGLLAWIILRFELLSRAEEHVDVYELKADVGLTIATKVTRFREEIPHYMYPFATVFYKLGFTPAEVLLLFDLSPDERAELYQYLLDSELLKFSQILSFKRALRQTNDGGSDPFTSPDPAMSQSRSLNALLSHFPGSLDAKIEAFAGVGIDTLEELNRLCASPAEDIEEVINMMIDNGLRFPELGAVFEGLRLKGADLRF